MRLIEATQELELKKLELKTGAKASKLIKD
jgi:hypothetical protein